MKIDAHALLALHILAEKLPAPVHEYRFHPKRRWRWDMAWLDQKLAVEVHGGTWTGGRHTRGNGFAADRVKMNAGVELGWKILEYTTEQVEDGSAIRQLKRILK